VPKKITPATIKHKRFAECVARGKSAVSSYREAYPNASQATAETNATRLLEKASVQEEIAKRLSEITPEDVLLRIDEMSRTATPADNVKVRCLEMLGNTRKASIFKDSAPAITNNTLNVFDLDDLRLRLADNTYSLPAIEDNK
jgi:CO dehydrogenase/acetyl-CoA synthase delta subunit